MDRSNRIYISDLDGTLLTKEAALSEFTRTAIINMVEAGIHFTVATARSITSTIEILGDLPLKLPVICSNGGSIWDYRNRQPIHIEYIDADLRGELIEGIINRRDSAFISSVHHGKEKVYYKELANEGMAWYYRDRLQANDLRMTELNRIGDAARFDLTTITFMDRWPQIQSRMEYYNNRYGARIRLNTFENKYSPGWYWLSLHSARSTKAHAMKRLLSELNGTEFETVVFGDEMNDVPAFNSADHAVAVGNALPALKEIADVIIDDHTKDSVVKYILQQEGITSPSN